MINQKLQYFLIFPNNFPWFSTNREKIARKYYYYSPSNKKQDSNRFKADHWMLKWMKNPQTHKQTMMMMMMLDDGEEKRSKKKKLNIKISFHSFLPYFIFCTNESPRFYLYHALFFLFQNSRYLLHTHLLFFSLLLLSFFWITHKKIFETSPFYTLFVECWIISNDISKL